MLRCLLLIVAALFIAKKADAVGVEEASGQAPMIFFMTQNSPNPFWSVTEFIYGVPDSGEVDIAVYDARGNKAAALGHGIKPPGCYTMCWSGRSEHGEKLQTGIYFCRIRMNGRVRARKFILLNK